MRPVIGLAVDALACWRLTRLATTDTITEQARDFVEARSVEIGHVMTGGADDGFCVQCGHERAWHALSGGWCAGRSAVSGTVGCSYECDGYQSIASPRPEPVTVDVQPWAFARDLLDCHWCASVWMAGVTVLLPRRVRYGLAVAALAGLLADRAER